MTPFHGFFLTKNAHFCQGNTFEIDQRGKIPDFFTIPHLFSLEEIHTNEFKTNFLRRFIQGNVDTFYHSEVTRKNLHNSSTLSYGQFQVTCNTKSPWTFLV